MSTLTSPTPSHNPYIVVMKVARYSIGGVCAINVKDVVLFQCGENAVQRKVRSV